MRLWRASPTVKALVYAWVFALPSLGYWVCLIWFSLAGRDERDFVLAIAPCCCWSVISVPFGTYQAIYAIRTSSSGSTKGLAYLALVAIWSPLAAILVGAMLSALGVID